MSITRFAQNSNWHTEYTDHPERCTNIILCQHNNHLALRLTCMNFQLVEDTSYFGTEYNTQQVCSCLQKRVRNDSELYHEITILLVGLP